MVIDTNGYMIIVDSCLHGFYVIILIQTHNYRIE